MAVQYKNFVEGTLDAAISGTGNQDITVNWATNATVPTGLSVSNYMLFVIDPEGANGAPEIVRATNITGSGPYTLALTGRGEGSSSARTHADESKVVAAVTAEQIDNFATKDGTTFTGDVTVGANTAGHDVKFFGNSDGHYMWWDASADELVFPADTKISFYDAAGGEKIQAASDGHLNIDAGTTLDLTAPTIDLNASTVVNVDGKTTLKDQADILTLQDSGATGQSGYIRFKDSGGTNLGYIGYPSNDDIYIKNEDADGDIYIWAASGRSVKILGNIFLGSDGSGHDVTFNSDTAGENMVWSSSAEKLTITGTAGQDALHVAAGNVNFDGALDVSGTTNLDVVDIDGTVNIAADLTLNGHVLGSNPIPLVYYSHSGAAGDAQRVNDTPQIFVCTSTPSFGLDDGDIWFDIS